MARMMMMPVMVVTLLYSLEQRLVGKATEVQRWGSWREGEEVQRWGGWEEEAVLGLARWGVEEELRGDRGRFRSSSKYPNLYKSDEMK